MDIIQRMAKKLFQLGSFSRDDVGTEVRFAKNPFGIADTTVAGTASAGHLIPGSQAGKQNEVDVNCQNDDDGDGQQDAVPLHSWYLWYEKLSEEAHLIEMVTFLQSSSMLGLVLV